VAGGPKVISGPGEYEVSGILIIGVATFHDGERGAERGKNTVYVMQIDDVSVCHLGDLGHPLTAGQIEEIGDVDVLLLPVGGISTIDAPAAAQVVRQLEAKVVVPMHYQTPALTRTLDPVDRFFKEMSVGQIEPQAKLSVSKSSLPASTQIYYLSY
jgi:L-ascorbate metabolism protein UlaG (beta-lactamase superfamily)